MVELIKDLSSVLISDYCFVHISSRLKRSGLQETAYLFRKYIHCFGSNKHKLYRSIITLALMTENAHECWTIVGEFTSLYKFGAQRGAFFFNPIILQSEVVLKFLNEYLDKCRRNAGGNNPKRRVERERTKYIIVICEISVGTQSEVCQKVPSQRLLWLNSERLQTMDHLHKQIVEAISLIKVDLLWVLYAPKGTPMLQKFGCGCNGRLKRFPLSASVWLRSLRISLFGYSIPEPTSGSLPFSRLVSVRSSWLSQSVELTRRQITRTVRSSKFSEWQRKTKNSLLHL